MAVPSPLYRKAPKECSSTLLLLYARVRRLRAYARACVFAKISRHIVANTRVRGSVLMHNYYYYYYRILFSCYHSYKVRGCVCVLLCVCGSAEGGGLCNKTSLIIARAGHCALRSGQHTYNTSVKLNTLTLRFPKRVDWERTESSLARRLTQLSIQVLKHTPISFSDQDNTAAGCLLTEIENGCMSYRELFCLIRPISAIQCRFALFSVNIDLSQRWNISGCTRSELQPMFNFFCEFVNLLMNSNRGNLLWLTVAAPGGVTVVLAPLGQAPRTRKIDLYK